jgi:hypothetical protein
MENSDFNCNWSDAWLLLAVILSSKKRPAALEDIIAAGDSIDFAIFNADELESGLARLTSEGYVVEKDEGFAVTAKLTRSLPKFKTSFRSIHKQLEDVCKIIGAAPAISEQPHLNNLKYPGFSAKKYQEAVKRYTEKSDTK